jgi:Asp/Glu/hydantoin racemase
MAISSERVTTPDPTAEAPSRGLVATGRAVTRRVLVLSPLGTDYHDAETLALASSAVSAHTEVHVRSLADGVPKTAFLPAASRFYNQLLREVERAAEEGFDAAVIACASDPALSEAKELVDIPVTAPMEAALHLAAPFGRLGIVAPRIQSGENENLPANADWVRRLVHRYGFDYLVGSIRSARAGHPSDEEVSSLFAEDTEELRRRVRTSMADSIAGPALEQAKRAVEEDEAAVLFFACTTWSGLLDPIRSALNVRVIDPLLDTVRFAETLALVGR